MARLEEMVRRQMREAEWEARVDDAAHALLASLFYFEPAHADHAPWTSNSLTHPGTRHVHGASEIHGTVRSRLRHGSTELARLLARVQGLAYTTLAMSRAPAAALLQHDPWTEIAAFHPVKDKVVASGHRFRVPVRLEEASESKLLVLAVRLTDCAAPLPISGFPTLLHDLHLKAKSWD
ncbi:hypothetical protein CLAIMM_08101 [Cladophialophora immunda]|nr:hypothetical protein CLAIMM_08101 [Cladophialophora immunda]